MAVFLNITGLLTRGAIVAFLAPTFVLKQVFGVTDVDTGNRFLAMHWGLLVFLVGGMLVYSGYRPEIRVPVMLVAATEKLVGSGLILAGSLRRKPIAITLVAADSFMGLGYLLLLL